MKRVIFSTFGFSFFMLLWGVCFLLPHGTFFGWGYLIAVGIVFLSFLRRRVRNRRAAVGPPSKLFSLPKLKLTGEPLTIPPELNAEAKQYLARITSGFDIFHPDCRSWRNVNVIPWIGLLFCLIGLFAPPAARVVGAMLTVLMTVNFLVFAPAVISFHRSLRRFGAKLAEWRPAISRPAFDPEDPQQCDYFARHFDDAFKARVALELVKALKIDFMVYPEDALWLLPDRKGLSQLLIILWRSSMTPELETLGEWVSRRTVGGGDAVHTADLPAQNPACRPPPAWPEKLRQLIRTENDRFLPCNDGKADAFLRSRPLSTYEEFVSCWPTRREAEIAWVIRNALIDEMGRPEDMMTYPNDPMALLDFWEGDSLENVEFIMRLEEHFGIVIPTNETEPIFYRFDLRDAVHYIMAKLDAVEPQPGQEKTPSNPQ